MRLSSHAPTDCHAPCLTHANLAPPKSVTVEVNVDDNEAKSQVVTIMRESSFLVEAMDKGYHVYKDM